MSREQNRDSGLQGYMKHVMAMKNLTKNHLVNTYWHNIEEIQKNGSLPFILTGSLEWKSTEGTQLQSKSKRVCLESKCYDPVGKHILENPIMVHRQSALNLYDTWGWIKADLPKEVSSAKRAIEDAVFHISLLSDIASLMSSASLTWYPARYVELQVLPVEPPSSALKKSKEWKCLRLPRESEGTAFITVEDDFFTKDVLPAFEALRSLSNVSLRNLLCRAIAWHARGNVFGSKLTRFVSYWESIELLAHGLYIYVSTSRSNKAERRRQILERLSDVNKNNCFEIVQNCYSIMNTSITDKLRIVLPKISTDKQLSDKLFSSDGAGQKSLYQLRNDIVHGNCCEHDLEFAAEVEEKLYLMLRYSHQAITGAAKNAHSLISALESESLNNQGG